MRHTRFPQGDEPPLRADASSTWPNRAVQTVHRQHVVEPPKECSGGECPRTHDEKGAAEGCPTKWY
jgi:hypothetical protein